MVTEDSIMFINGKEGIIIDLTNDKKILFIT